MCKSICKRRVNEDKNTIKLLNMLYFVNTNPAQRSTYQCLLRTIKLLYPVIAHTEENSELLTRNDNKAVDCHDEKSRNGPDLIRIVKDLISTNHNDVNSLGSVGTGNGNTFDISGGARPGNKCHTIG